MTETDEVKLRRFAFQIALQLPENKQQALAVLDFARQLVLWENALGVAGSIAALGAQFLDSNPL